MINYVLFDSIVHLHIHICSKRFIWRSSKWEFWINQLCFNNVKLAWLLFFYLSAVPTLIEWEQLSAEKHLRCVKMANHKHWCDRGNLLVWWETIVNAHYLYKFSLHIYIRKLPINVFIFIFCSLRRGTFRTQRPAR